MKKILHDLFIVVLCVAWILPCVASCTSSSPPIATSASVLELSKLNITEYDTIAYHENTFYILNKNGIYVVDAASFSLSATIDLPNEYCYLYVEQGSIYLADKLQNTLCVYSFSSNQIGDLIQQYSLPENIHAVYNISVSDTMISLSLYLRSTEEEHSHAHDGDTEEEHTALSQCVWIIDRTNNTTQELNASLQKVLAAATVTTDEIFYVSRDIVDYNALYSLSKNTSQKLFQIDNQCYLDNIFYDRASDTIWYFINGYIQYYSPKENSETTFYYVADLIPDAFKSYVSNGIFVADDHVYVTHYASDTIIDIASAPAKKTDVETNDDAYTLQILISEDDTVAFGEIKKIIFSEYNINVEQIKYDSDTAEDKIRLKLLANDSDFDLFCVSSKNIDHYSKNHAFYDVSSSTTIVQNFNAMFDGLYDLCISNDILCGVPISVNRTQNLWNCNTSLLETLNLALPLEKITWKEFYDWAVILKEQATDAGIADFVVYAQNGVNIQLIEYMSNYMDYTATTVLDHTTEYIEYLDLYFKMLKEGLISDSTDSHALFTSGGHYDYMTTSAIVFPSPVLTEDAQYTVGVNLLAINPSSQHIEQAIEYLAYASSEEVLNFRPSEYLLKDRSHYQYINNSGERVLYESTTNGHDVLAFLLKNSTRQYFNRDVFQEMNADILKLRNQEMSTSDFAKKLYDKALMIIEE